MHSDPFSFGLCCSFRRDAGEWNIGESSDAAEGSIGGCTKCGDESGGSIGGCQMRALVRSEL